MIDKFKKKEISTKDLTIKFFDSEYYLSQYSDIKESNIDPLNHFLNFGWRESRKPNKWFKESMISSELIHKNKDIPPFIIFIEECRKKGFNDFESYINIINKKEIGHINCTDCQFMKELFDGKFYRSFYSDLTEVEDALAHYCSIGWKEGRDPNINFETNYYLENNSDVKQANINPFVHYINEGIREQRKPRALNPVKNLLLNNIPNFEKEITPSINEKIKIGKKDILLNKLYGNHNGIILSISHDDYVRSIGGIQIFIRNESLTAIDSEKRYLHISPLSPKNQVSDEPLMLNLVNVNIDNLNIGIFSLSEISEILDQLEEKFKHILNTLVVHSVLGWNLNSITEVFSSRFINYFYYVHDYNFICKEYRLLRNFIENCGAPSVNSVQCRICTHSNERSKHLDEFKKFFENTPFKLIFPSEAAHKIYINSGIELNNEKLIKNHITIKKININKISNQKEIFTNPIYKKKLKIGFCGEPVPHKGYFHFLELVRKLSINQNIEFYHLGNYKSNHRNIKFVKTTIKNNISEMTDNIRDNQLDFVFMGSYWAETFNYVAYEAVEAGAALIANSNSGNISNFVAKYKIGFLFDSIEDCISKINNNDEIINILEYSKKNINSIKLIKNKSFIFEN
jgi:hypothetical protein